MVIGLGSRYLENLERIGMLVAAQRNGAYSKKVKVLIEPYDMLEEVEARDERRPNGSTCYFNGCTQHFDEIDTRVSLHYDRSGKVETFQFHSDCLDHLVEDIS